MVIIVYLIKTNQNNKFMLVEKTEVINFTER